MPYMKKTYTCGEVVEVVKYYLPSQQPQGMVRGAKTKKTTDAMEKYNAKQAAAKLRRLINTNFGLNDLWITLTYRRESKPADPEDARRLLKNFNQQLRREYKKRGMEYKFIAVSEYGPRGGIHHHLVVNKIDMEVISAAWRWGHVHFVALDEKGQYKRLAEYMIKETAKNYADPKCTLVKQRYACSRNLKQPEVKVEELKAKRWKPVPEPPAGWMLDKDSVIDGRNEFTGLYYQFYAMVRIPVWKPYQEEKAYAKPPAATKKRRKNTKAAAGRRTQRKPHVPAFTQPSLFEDTTSDAVGT